MLLPKKTKYRKAHRGRLTGISKRNTKVALGSYGLKALEPIWLNSKQIEAARRTISRYTKRAGKLIIKVFPDKPVTFRAKESRMGSGKGSVEFWVAVIRPETVIFELNGIPKELAYQALKIAAYKLPMKTKIVI